MPDPEEQVSMHTAVFFPRVTYCLRQCAAPSAFCQRLLAFPQTLRRLARLHNGMSQ